MADIIEIPDFDFSAFYYSDILKALIAFNRQNVPEITDESDEEAFTQITRAFSLVGHLSNVLIDIAATETLLPTARLLESVRAHLKLIDVILDQNKPAAVDAVVELSKLFTTSTNFIPVGTQVATEEGVGLPQIIYEADGDNTIEPTTSFTAIFAFDPGIVQILDNSFDGGDEVTILGVSFVPGIDFPIGADIFETVGNLVTAFNASQDIAIEDEAFAFQVGDKAYINLKNLDLPTIPISVTDPGTTNFSVRSGGFNPNKSGESIDTGLLFDMFDNSIEPGSIFYLMHQNIMWDAIEFTLNTVGSGIVGVWEFYDGDVSEANPDTVTNLGSNLELDLTSFLGTADRSGSLVRITYSQNGNFEEVISKFEGGKNIVRTTGLLGQISVSTLASEYLIGSEWNEVSDLIDATATFTKIKGKINYSIPQNLSQNWISKSINTTDGFALRFRVISISAPVSPEINLIDITKGKQFLLFPATQGSSSGNADNPLGSSDGSANQSLTLSVTPILVESLSVELDEGTGFTEWTKVENFLNSVQNSKDYVLEVFADDTAKITFGNGIQGKIPSLGVDNIRAFYRVGGDVDGNVGALTITVNKSGIPFVNRVFNPRPAIGHAFKEGSTDEDLARLKIEGPATLRTRNRAITPDDYEFLATQFETIQGSRLVSRALAIEETFGVKTIELVVVGLGGILLSQSQLDSINDFFNGNKSSGIKGVGLTNHEATAVNYTPNVIDVTATVEGGNKTQIENAIKSLINPEAKFADGVTNRWDFGDKVPTAIIISEIIAVDPQLIKDVDLTSPAGDVQLGARELPSLGNLNITVI